MFSCEDYVTFISDKKDHSDFYKYGNECTKAGLETLFSLKSEIYLLAKNILRFPEASNLLKTSIIL